MFTRPVLVGLVAASVLVSAGCSSDESESSPTPRVPAPSSTAPSLGPSAAAERDALAAYSALWLSMAKAGEVPDPDAPELRKYAAGDALARVVRALATYRETGVVTRGRPVNSPRVVSAAPADAPTEVKLTDCGDSSGWTSHKKSTGEQLKDDPRGRRLITATVSRVDGAWKVTSFNLGEIGSC